jgi:regulator of nonsense transcripts 1
VLECYICLNRNIFLLGFVPLQSSDVKQVIIVCRTPCLAMKSFAEIVWDISDWTALVEEKMIVNWLVAVPTQEEQQNALNITMSQICQLEDLRFLIVYFRKENPNA